MVCSSEMRNVVSQRVQRANVLSATSHEERAAARGDAVRSRGLMDWLQLTARPM